MLLYVPMERDPIEELYDRYAAMLYRLALSELKNREDAEDAVQAVFEKYVLAPHLFFSREHEKAWMLRVTMNQCRDMLRRRQQRYAVPLDEAADVGVQDAHSEVLDVLEKLPEDYRVPLTLYYFEDCKVEEIAQARGSMVRPVPHRPMASCRANTVTAHSGASSGQNTRAQS